MKRFISQRCQLSHLLPRLSAAMLVLLSLAGMTISCSSTDDISDNASSKNTLREVVIKATSDLDSRVDFTEDASKLGVTWSNNNSDKLIMKFHSSSFIQSDVFKQVATKDGDSHTAYFSGYLDLTLTDFYAVVNTDYVYDPGTNVSYFTYSLDEPDGTLAGAGLKDIIFAKGTSSVAGEVPTFNFQHKSSILKLEISLPNETAATATNIYFSARSGICTQYKFECNVSNEAKETYNMGAGLHISNTTISGNKLTLYIPITSDATNTLTAAKLSFYAGSNYYLVDLGNKALTPGRFYKKSISVANPTMVPASDFAGGSGTQEDPWKIANAAQMWRMNYLNNVENLKSKYYELSSNINLNSNIPWLPVKSFYNSSFDGKDFEISGLNSAVVIDATTCYAGLFGLVENNSVIKNLIVINATISQNAYCGIIASTASNNSTIVNCKASGTVSGDYTGGIVGTLASSSVIACSSSATMSGNYAGGIVGYNLGVVAGCYSTGGVSAPSTTDTSVGGIAGLNTASIISCYSTGTIANAADIGGIVGTEYNSSTGCYTKSSNDGSTNTLTNITNMNTSTIVNAMNAAIKAWNSGTYNSASVAGTIYECKYHYDPGTAPVTTPVLVAGAPQ